MTVSRSRKEVKEYTEYQKTLDKNVCSFCVVTNSDEQFISATTYFKVIRNIFPYSIWDGQTVVDHLLITPKAHTDTIKDMPDEQKVEYVNLLEEYEHKGYNIYARAPGSRMKSIVHQHTHLIKSEGDPKKITIHFAKPYVRLVK
jgi:diadenosine tetraphosphate (Ap4A) HIT family hydrolase